MVILWKKCFEPSYKKGLNSQVSNILLKLELDPNIVLYFGIKFNMFLLDEKMYCIVLYFGRNVCLFFFFLFCVSFLDSCYDGVYEVRDKNINKDLQGGHKSWGWISTNSKKCGFEEAKLQGI